VELFATRARLNPFKFPYAVSSDGRFLVNDLQLEDTARSPITLILNWKP
jgi:hypothetical protein